jgi:hypothetical protein
MTPGGSKRAELSLTARSKIAKLIPRLATDFNGEVVATVAAIQRVLRTEGYDLHDLAAHVLVPLPVHQRATPARPAEPVHSGRYAGLINGCLEQCRERWEFLRVVERKFVGSIRWRVSRGKSVTDDEIGKLEWMSDGLVCRRRKYKPESKGRGRRKSAT